jgi:hypothetical protein
MSLCSSGLRLLLVVVRRGMLALVEMFWGGVMKISYFACALFVLTAVGTSDGAAGDLKISTKNLKPVAEGGLYLVTLKCTANKLPEQYTTIFEAPVRQLAFTITLSTSRVGANLTPAASSVIVAVPVIAATISHSNPVSFVNGGCNQALLITGRNPLYLTAMWTDAHSITPSPFVTVVTSLAGLASPLSVLFPTGAANLLKQDTGIPSPMSQAYSQLLGSLSTSDTETITTEAMQQGYYLIQTPGGSISISIGQISSIQSAFGVPEIRDAFDGSFQALGPQVRQDRTSCIAIGRTLENYQNLSHADAVYALARIVVASAIPGPDVVTCLGTAYGPEVAQDSYWKQKSGITLSPSVWIDTENPLAYSPTRFEEIVSALNNYQGRATDKTTLGEYFSDNIKITDLTQIVSPPASTTADKIIDKLNGAQYVFFGCQQKDSAQDDDNKPDVGFILAVPKSLKQSDIILMRVWWALDRPGNSHPRINEMFISNTESDLVSTALTAFNNQCGKANIPKQKSSGN